MLKISCFQLVKLGFSAYFSLSCMIMIIQYDTLNISGFFFFFFKASYDITVIIRAILHSLLTFYEQHEEMIM